MTRRDWFSVGVRLIGVWELIIALDETRLALAVHLGFIASRTTTFPNTMAEYIMNAVVSAAVGIYLVIGAPQLINLAFYRSPGPTCANCGYDLTATPDRCPECGSVPVHTPEER